MKTSALLLLAALVLPLSPGRAQQHPTATMTAFASDSAMKAFLRRFVRRMARMGDATAMNAPAPMAGADGMGSARLQAGSEAITNVQMQGVDEGDIVKLHGDYLVILRRGRLFSVAVGGGELRAASTTDAFGPGINPTGTWYDEMLISGDKVVVIGYSYERGGTEAGIFRLAADGSLHYVSTFQLRSNDYYSSRNYASRLIGSKLVFYSPLYLDGDNITEELPAYRRWSRQSGTRGFQVMATPERVFRPAGWEPTYGITMHTVTSCELDAPEVRCEATVVMGPSGEVFYVSGTAAYVWMVGSFGASATRNTSMLVRIPLDGSRPTAERVSGSPVDQFSFLESDGHINVLTVSDGSGDGMWSAERAAGTASLLRLPLDSMGDGSRRAASWWYRRLPSVSGGTFQNRFVGDFLLYGTGSGWGGEESSDRLLFAVPWRGGDISAVRLAHGTDRIEVMGEGAVVVGVRDSNLEFTGLRLRGAMSIVQRYTMANASQGELRSHGFFYRSDAPGAGVIGLPVREENRPGYSHLVEGSASILYLRNSGARFRLLGKLEAGDVRSANDGCRASCVDWYGNARPIFARGRVFALLGYEIVEGRIQNSGISEVRRVTFAPAPGVALR